MSITRARYRAGEHRVRGAALSDSESGSTVTAETRERVEDVIERLRPAIQADGGDIELVDVTSAGVVKVRLHGACVGCPSSTMTLRIGIERNLRAHVPEVTGVEALE